MSITSELLEQVTAVAGFVGADASGNDLPGVIDGLPDAQVVELLRAADALARGAERVRIVAAGVVAARSTRDAGHSGLAQSRGHRNPVSLVQELTGGTRAEAAKQVRIGEALREGLDDAAAPGAVTDTLLSIAGDGPDAAGAGAVKAALVRSWHAPLRDALLAGSISSAQHDVILRGLGEPPAPPALADATSANVPVEKDLDRDCTDGAGDDDDVSDGERGLSDSGIDEARRHTVREAWALAAEQLAEEAPHRTVEELAQLARMIRDQLDPEGADRRFQERFDARGFRLWTDADGLNRGSFVFDDLGAAWVRSIIDAALRPRRGGPRFIDPDEKARAKELATDPRSIDQLAYDLILDVLRAGSLAEPETVFGTRQAGIRLVQVIDVSETPAPVAHTEDGLTTLPGWLAQQQLCDTGQTTCRVDVAGNPLDLGREQRLFSPRQRIALALRDGGCRWRGCDRPASYCEAHHIDPYSTGGRTDIDRGVLLCRYHHMALHNGGWRITREGRGEFMLHPPGGRLAGEGREKESDEGPIPLKPRLALTYAWAGIDPPP